jgi:hypothetical protein
MKTTKKTKIITALALALVLLALFFWRGRLAALAQELIDSFTDTSRVSDTWNVTVATTTGEVKLTERSCDPSVWICDQADVCENAYGDGEYILVASTTVAGTKQWKTANTACNLPECALDGGQDGDVLDADNTISFMSYPARQACKEMGGRLPTVAELSCIYQYRASNFNNNFSTGHHWTATEYSDTYARYIYFTDGYVGNYNKTSANSVRCVRGW